MLIIRESRVADRLIADRIDRDLLRMKLRTLTLELADYFSIVVLNTPA
jgi:hypothetical protein